MKFQINKSIAVFVLIISLVFPSLHSAVALSDMSSESADVTEQISIEMSFSDVTFETHGNTIAIRVPETNFNKMTPGNPVVPAYIETLSLPFGSDIIDVTYDNATAEIIPITGVLAQASYPGIDLHHPFVTTDTSFGSTYTFQDEMYPSDWISYHVGGGLDFSDHVTFFTLRMYPARYNADEHHIEFTDQISVTITYQPPEEPFFNDVDLYDLLIIAPEIYHDELN